MLMWEGQILLKGFVLNSGLPADRFTPVHAGAYLGKLLLAFLSQCGLCTSTSYDDSWIHFLGGEALPTRSIQPTGNVYRLAGAYQMWIFARCR